MAKRVLIVEDEPDILELERLVAEDLLECEVIVASTGEEALERAAESPPDLIVLDLLLPGIDGFVVAARLRGELGLTARILAVSGLAGQEDRDRAMKAGCDVVVTKPFDVDDLARRLGELLASCSPGIP